MLRMLLALAVLLALGSPATSHPAARYIPGRGLHLLDDSLVLGGYTAIDFRVLDQQRHELSLDDLSLFLLYSPTSSLNFFTEFELEESLHLDGDGVGDGFHPGQHVANLERLYVEYQPSDNLSIRIGKRLTPIGIWNPIHAEPLVWTVSRPAATEDFFDTHFTGVELESRKRIGRLSLVTTVFGQPVNSPARSTTRRRTRRGLGGRVGLGRTARWHVAGSFLRFQDDRDRLWRNLFGADALFSSHRWELSSEFVLVDPSRTRREWSGYLQAVYHTRWKLHPVVRYEHVDLQQFTRDPLSLGLVYKWRPNTAIKLEGVLGRGGLSSAGNGLLASYTQIF